MARSIGNEDRSGMSRSVKEAPAWPTAWVSMVQEACSSDVATTTVRPWAGMGQQWPGRSVCPGLATQALLCEPACGKPRTGQGWRGGKGRAGELHGTQQRGSIGHAAARHRRTDPGKAGAEAGCFEETWCETQEGLAGRDGLRRLDERQDARRAGACPGAKVQARKEGFETGGDRVAFEAHRDSGRSVAAQCEQCDVGR